MDIIRTAASQAEHPTSNSLKQDLEDAAKAAAEAAAEQAALEIAAKAFCRIAVPALLAPLEALEDIIPIFREIADVAEIAAAPAIIKGCVKGMEKEGQAEFKIFGKKHVVKVANTSIDTRAGRLNKPAGKPTDVPDRPSASDHPPAKTGDKGQPKEACKAKQGSRIKRATEPVPTLDHFDNDARKFTILKTISPFPSDENWKESADGKGFALQQTFNNLPSAAPHGFYIAGYVEISYQDRNRENDCGEVALVNRYWTRRYLAWSYDLVTDNMLQGGRCLLSDHARNEWAAFGADRTTYKYLGRIKPGLTEASIEIEAEDLHANMGTHNLINNNCFTFVKKIYNAEQAF